MSLIQFPFIRKYYPGKTNPVFVTDTQAANQGLLDAITAVTGLSGSGFAIITGLNYVTGVPNTFTPGIIWFNGTFYYCATTFNEGNCLAPNPQDILPETFEDTTINNIYTVQYAAVTAVSAGSTPQFTGNMNAYRISLTYLQGAVAALQAIAAGLGNSSTLNVGTTAGTVAAGNDSRLVYNLSQFNTLFGGKAPAFKGNISMNYDIDGTFLTNFDGTGLGIVSPWIGWARFNGNNGLPDATGTMFVGVGSGFVSKIAGGANSYQIQATDLPVLLTANKFATTGGGTVTAYAETSVGSSALSQEQVNGGSPNNAISLLSRYIPVYIVGQIV
jgi:hypothetical protein